MGAYSSSTVVMLTGILIASYRHFLRALRANLSVTRLQERELVVRFGGLSVIIFLRSLCAMEGYYSCYQQIRSFWITCVVMDFSACERHGCCQCLQLQGRKWLLGKPQT